MLERENNVLSGNNSAEAGGEEEMGMASTCSQNGSQLTFKNCTHMGVGRQKKEESTVGDMAQDCGKGA